MTSPLVRTFNIFCFLTRAQSPIPEIYLDEKFDRDGVFFEVDDDAGSKVVFPNGTIVHA